MSEIIVGENVRRGCIIVMSKSYESTAVRRMDGDRNDKRYGKKENIYLNKQCTGDVDNRHNVYWIVFDVSIHL